MAKATDRLANLEEQRAQIEAEMQRVRARNEAMRKRVLVGAWMMGKVQSGEWPEQKLIEAMDSYLECDQDRALFRELFGLQPKQPQPQQPEAVQYNQDDQGVQGGE